MAVRTRFAPSPTGYMHLGGMRTALFNWLWARRSQGQFLLRVDDTDQKRNVTEALEPILEAFRWLGLEWDEGPEVGGPHGPYFQSQRRAIHRVACDQLVRDGHAYADFEPAEETRRQRESARQDKRSYVNSRSSLDLSADEVAEKKQLGQPYVIRLLVPRERTVRIRDRIRGDVEWDCSLMADPVIARSDGSPLYNLATAVDDAEMQISHVIRAEEHLSNTPVQVLILQALGKQLPEYAHIPYVAAPASKKKLSKRETYSYLQKREFRSLFELGSQILDRAGRDSKAETMSPVMVAFYRETGFLPAGLLNALARLGWSLDDNTEYLSLSTLKECFSLDRVIRGPAGFDPNKLMSYQMYWMAQLSEDEKVDGCLKYLIRAGLIDEQPTESDRSKVGRVIRLAGDRLRVFGDILSLDEFFVADDRLNFDEKDFRKRLINRESVVGLIRSVQQRLESCDPFEASELQTVLNEFVAKHQIRFGDIAPALRVCVTGRAQGADLSETLGLIGRRGCLARIDRALALVDAHNQSE